MGVFKSLINLKDKVLSVIGEWSFIIIVIEGIISFMGCFH